jgi:rhodanese-related sulfurtransferase
MQGFDVANVEGGMKSWAASGKPLESDHGSPHVL